MVDEKERYFCVRCRYKFSRSPSSNRSLLCPYCGKEDKIVPDQFSAQDFVNSSENSEKFYRFSR